jgi:hypothetical protein
MGQVEQALLSAYKIWIRTSGGGFWPWKLGTRGVIDSIGEDTVDNTSPSVYCFDLITRNSSLSRVVFAKHGETLGSASSEWEPYS